MTLVPTLLDQPLSTLLDEPSASDASGSVVAFVVRVAGVAYEVAQHAPESALVKALATASPEALLDAVAALLLAELNTPGDTVSGAAGVATAAPLTATTGTGAAMLAQAAASAATGPT